MTSYGANPWQAGPYSEAQGGEDLQDSKRRRLSSPLTSAQQVGQPSAYNRISSFDDCSDGCPTPPRELESFTLHSATSAEPPQGLPSSFFPRLAPPIIAQGHATFTSMSENGQGDIGSSRQAWTRPVVVTPTSGPGDVRQELPQTHALQQQPGHWEEAFVHFVASDKSLRAYALQSTRTEHLRASLQLFSARHAIPATLNLLTRIVNWRRSYDAFRKRLSLGAQTKPVREWNETDQREMRKYERNGACRTRWISVWHDAFCLEWPDSAALAAEPSSNSLNIPNRPAQTTSNINTGRSSSFATAPAVPPEPSPLVAVFSVVQPPANSQAGSNTLATSTSAPRTGAPSFTSQTHNGTSQLEAQVTRLESLVVQQSDQIVFLHAENLQQSYLLAQHSRLLQSEAQQKEEHAQRSREQSILLGQQGWQLNLQAQRSSQLAESFERLERRIDFYHALASQRP